MEEIKLGDIVGLKIVGTPLMVVNAIRKSFVDAIYINQSGQPETITMNVKTLIKMNGK
jgi:hypothetical protein